MSMAITGVASATPLALGQALLVGRGGATIVAASGVASLANHLVLTSRGGAISPEVSRKADTSSITPVGKSILCMATGMAIHYLGYSFARSITVALFTSASTGYPGIPGAFPFAMAFVSPVSLLLLVGYGRVLQSYGPRGALKSSTLCCAAVILAASLGIEVSERTGASILGIPAMKFITGPLFVFRESYVQLLTSQYWSFMASVLTPNQSARWFAPIAGLTSIASVVGGVAVSHLTAKIKLSGTLACTGVALCASLFATEAAYSIAEANGFDPSGESKKTAQKGKDVKEKGHGITEIFGKASKLFSRVPVLRALFLEILASQSLATLLNVCFVQSIGASIPNDSERAGWIGQFYALINLITMLLQFGVLPLLMQVIEPKDLWRFTPIISVAFTSFQAFQNQPSLYVVSGSLLVMKVLEYSARRMLDEMVYVPLDFESRYVGKEIIGVFGYRLGKSLVSLVLSALTSAFGNFDLHQLSIFSDVMALAWAKTAWDLSALVPTRKEAQDAYLHSRKSKLE